MSLVEYLSNLNSSEEQWGLWVDPTDLDSWRVGQFCFENGGVLDSKVCVGTLDSLSFGFQSRTEIANTIYFQFGFDSSEELLERLDSEGSDEALKNEIEGRISEIAEVWSLLAAEEKIDELKSYFAPGGEWEQECAEAVCG